MLHLVQSVQGYVSPEGVTFCAEQLGLTKAEVGAVATFYTMYKRRPTGRHLVSVCTNTLCSVLGGQRIMDALSADLGVHHDETAADGSITLEHAECLSRCPRAVRRSPTSGGSPVSWPGSPSTRTPPRHGPRSTTPASTGPP
jgi:NADH-quinone oxidoreductase subunit E